MKPIIRIVISIFIAMIICQISFLIMNRGLIKYDYTSQQFIEVFLNNTYHDMLFIGSSRTCRSINPKIIDSICNVNSYNAGVDGGKLSEFEMTLEGYLQNHAPPKYLILTLDLFSFDIAKKFISYVKYLPYINNKAVNNLLCKKGYHTMAIKIFHFLILKEYNDLLRINSLKGWMGATEFRKGDFQYKGYLSNTSKCITATDTTTIPIKSMGISDTAIHCLEAIIEICKQNNIKLIFTYAPEYKFKTEYSTINCKEIFNLITSIALKNKIPYFRHDSLAICSNPNFFANINHLNIEGATQYTIILAKQLNQQIFNKKS